MPSSLARRWTALTPRERVLLIVASVTALAGLLVIAVWQPMRASLAEDALRQARDQHLLAALAALPTTTHVAVDSRSVATVVTETAVSQGLSILRLDTPKPDTATLTLQDAPLETLVLWIDGLNRTNGLGVLSATVRRTATPGVVSADLTLTRAAP